MDMWAERPSSEPSSWRADLPELADHWRSRRARSDLLEAERRRFPLAPCLCLSQIHHHGSHLLEVPRIHLEPSFLLQLVDPLELRALMKQAPSVQPYHRRL